jgi:hypothetical protein
MRMEGGSLLLVGAESYLNVRQNCGGPATGDAAAGGQTE